MPNDHATSADVSGISAVNTAPDGLHRSRLKEYLTSQAVGISVAIGGVMAARQLAPRSMNRLTGFVKEHCGGSLKGESAEYIAQQSSRTADYAVMFGAGLVSTVGTQIGLARRRRSNQEYGDEISFSRDLQRVMTGWGIGCFGALGSIALADRYLRGSSRHSIGNFLDKSEYWLDANVLHNVEFAQGRKLSEALVANVAMIPGGAPVSIIGQRFYDTAIAPPNIARDNHSQGQTSLL